MALIIPDMDYEIARRIFIRSHRVDHRQMKTIMIAFGRSQYDSFISTCRKYHYQRLFSRFKVTNIDDLLRVFLKKNSICNFPCYRRFKGDLNTSLISFSDLGARHRLIIYYLSVYHGYLWLTLSQRAGERNGYDYENFHRRTDGPVPYSLLERKRVNNLAYYDLVEKGRTLHESSFTLKEDAKIYRKGVTVFWKEIDCIKLIPSLEA